MQSILFDTLVYVIYFVVVALVFYTPKQEAGAVPNPDPKPKTMKTRKPMAKPVAQPIATQPIEQQVKQMLKEEPESIPVQEPEPEITPVAPANVTAKVKESAGGTIEQLTEKQIDSLKVREIRVVIREFNKSLEPGSDRRIAFKVNGKDTTLKWLKAQLKARLVGGAETKVKEALSVLDAA